MSRSTDGPATLTIPVGTRDHVTGPGDAPITLVEYGDFQCPNFREAYPIVKQVRDQLGARLRFAFRNFPLTRIHPHAEHAAEAAEAAAAQGAFWQMHDRLFERQFALEDENLVEYAAELGLDADRLAGELGAGTHRDRVRNDFHERCEERRERHTDVLHQTVRGTRAATTSRRFSPPWRSRRGDP